MASIKLKGDTSGEITIQAPSVAGTNTLNLQASSGTLATTAQASVGTKNLIINGDMRIDQRSATVTSAGYTVDRWRQDQTGGGGISYVKSTDAPDGFSHSLSATVTTTDDPASGDYYRLFQRIEGYNVSQLDIGTSSAKTITVSFWVKSSVTGTYCAALQNGSYNRAYATEYTINSANTWEQKTVTVALDTTGTWATDNTTGLQLYFDLGSGSAFNMTADTWAGTNTWNTSNQTKWINNSGATFYITGVQLEVGDTATPFENRMYSTELAMCQRYFIKTNPDDLARPTFLHGLHFANNASLAALYANLPTRMRTAPSITRGGTNDNFWNPGYSASATANFNPTYTLSTPDGLFIELSSISVGANSAPIGYNGQLSLNAEL